MKKARKHLVKKSVAVSMSAAMLAGAAAVPSFASETKWSEEQTADGWMKVTNEGGDTLGYSTESGVKIIEQDGYAFKDLDKDGELDVYEDWREDNETRAKDLAAQLPIEAVQGLMYHDSVFSIAADGSDIYNSDGSSFKDAIAQGVRTALNFAQSYPAETQAAGNNSTQAYAESQNYGIPINYSANPRDLSGWTKSLGFGATFDPDLVFESFKLQARQYSSVGISTLLGPQIDLVTDPRWRRTQDEWGEDPALARDMTNAAISGLQSTYSEDGTDEGWGSDSVVAMMKHFPGDGAGESGRESHNAYGKYTVYPGNGFETALIPFVDGGLNLDSITGNSGAVMLSYSIAYSDDESLGELVGSAYSEYKIKLLRETYNFDGLICTDWGVTNDIGDGAGHPQTPWGEEDTSKVERTYKAIFAGVDQIGGDENPVIAEAYQMYVDEQGEEAADTRFRESAVRILKTFFDAELFENPYVDSATAKELLEGDEAKEVAAETNRKSIVMIKNSENTIKAAEDGEKPTVYIPMQYKSGAWELPVERSEADKYYNVVTDSVGDPTGEADKDGNATYTTDDIIRATAEELADCDYALVIANNPDTGKGYDEEAEKYIPISLQYGEYTANSEYVRTESIAGDMVESEAENPYGVVKSLEKENRSYYGESVTATNYSDLEGILYAAENIPEAAKLIVAVNADRPMIFSEFEDKADAILMGFGIDNDYFLEVASGNYEPSGLLPLQMPANMEAVEAQLEDVPRDVECYVDANGNTYDFAFGLNWSGVIQDERTEKYNVEPMTVPENAPATQE